MDTFASRDLGFKLLAEAFELFPLENAVDELGVGGSVEFEEGTFVRGELGGLTPTFHLVLAGEG